MFMEDKDAKISNSRRLMRIFSAKFHFHHLEREDLSFLETQLKKDPIKK